MYRCIFLIWFICEIILCHKSIAQTIITFAGTGVAGGPLGDGGPATTAPINAANGGTFDKYGNYYVTEILGNRVRKITPSGIISTIVGIGGGGGYNGDGILAVTAKLNEPTAVAVDSNCNLYIADLNNFRIRKVDAVTGLISTVAGTGVAGYNGDGIPATSAQLAGPQDICLDRHGNLFIADQPNNRIRKLDATTGQISTVAGYGGFSGLGSGDGGVATAAAFNFIFGVIVDSLDNIYIADYNAARIRRVGIDGIINTVVGNGSWPYIGDGMPATAAQLNPMRMAFDKIGQLTVADMYSKRVYSIDNSDVLHCIAGNGGGGYSGDGGPATNATLDYPAGLAYDTCNNLYIAESTNRRVRKVYNAVTPSATVTITASTAGPLCAGTTVTYTATTIGGGTSTNYSWYINSTVVSGATGSSYSYAPGGSDTVRCRVSSFNACSMPAAATSNGIVLTVNPVVTPAISIAITPNDTVCAGTAVTLTATATGGGGTPAYQWYKNGSPVTTGTTYSYTPATGDIINCTLSSSAVCATTPVVSSNSITITVNPVVTPSISIAISPNDTVCAGTAVTLTATAANGGATPVYQWYKNGSPTTTGVTYSSPPANGDIINCTLASSAACATTPVVNSNSITITVFPLVTPAVSITITPDDTVCAGTTVTLAAVATGGGATPVYQWYKNGSPVTTGTTYSYMPATGDVINCTLTGSAACATTLTAGSNTITITLVTTVMPGIGITVSPNDTVCEGTPVTFTSTISGGGTAPTYQWYRNGIPVAAGPGYGYTPTDGDMVNCTLNSNATCAIVESVGSNSITLQVDAFITPAITISGPAASAPGSTVTVTAMVTNAGSSYTIHWLNHGTEFTTTTMPEVSYIKDTGTDTITARVVSLDAGCYDSTTSGMHEVLADHTGIATTTTGNISIYPNPVGGVLYISHSLAYTLFTITGTLVAAGQGSSIDVEQLPAGVYVLRMLTGNTTTILKVIKQ